MWHDVGNVRINLEVPATQRHHCRRSAHARWLVISKVRFLYGLPTYFKYNGNPINMVAKNCKKYPLISLCAHMTAAAH